MTQVLVIGAGPVGLTMAAELARYGCAVRIVDMAAARTDKSKALVVWSRSLELIDRMGCGPDFLGAGRKAVAASMFADRREIARIGFDGVDSPHPYGLMIPQSETERLLETHLQSLGVAVERGVEVTGFTAGDDEVTASLRHADGRQETVTAAWLAGCDGAHSIARRTLGFQFQGETEPADFILADVHLSGSPPPDDEVTLYWHADGLLALFPITAGRYRVVGDAGTAQGSAHRADPTVAEVQALLDARGPGGIRVGDPVWLAAFRINERKVAEYRAGRVFLVGDAAHIHSPAGGQGMNTGMQDAFNLAWKLALVCRGTCPSEPLLGSYSAERSPVGDQVLKNATRLTAIGVTRNRVLQTVRNAVAPFVLGLSAVRQGVADQLTEVSIGYPDSPLNGPYSRLISPEPGERVAPRAGETPVGAGGKPLFTLFADDDPGAAKLVIRFPDLLDPLIRPPLADGGICLLRPDGYVFATAREGNWAAIAEALAPLSPG